MIYTRNKQGFKTKTVKTGQNGSSSSKLSQNGLSLVDELRKRLQNKNKKPQHPNDAIDSHQNRQFIHRPKSTTPKKLTISKNFPNNPIHPNSKTDNEESSLNNVPENKMKTFNLNTHAQSRPAELKQKNSFVQAHFSDSQRLGGNPFIKIKKDPFIELINHNQSFSAANNQSFSSNSRKDGQKNTIQEIPSIQSKNNRKSLSQREDRIRDIYESPIQELDKSNYSSKQISKQVETVISSKQAYENQVKKWNTKKRQIINDSNRDERQTMTLHSTIQSEAQTQKQQEKLQNSLDVTLRKQFTLRLASQTVNDNVVGLTPFRKSSAQKEYDQLLQTQISALRKQLSKCNEQIHNLYHFNQTLSKTNDLINRQNLQLKDQLKLAQEKLINYEENSSVVQNFQRLFEKVRNLLIVNAMEMIETKNFLQLHFAPSTSSSLVTSPQGPYKNSQSKLKSTIKSKPFVQESDCFSRIQSINKCLAKIEQTIEVTQAVVKINHERHYKSQPSQTGDNNKLQIRELQETVNYKDKIIAKLKEEIIQLRQKPLSKQAQKHDQSYYGKPYSYVDQIHLLRHQINRLTQENCVFYDKYSQMKSQLSQRQHQNNFPNHQSIVEIESLINKLDKNQVEQLKNSKLDYWTSSKPQNAKNPSPQSGRHNTLQHSKSKAKPTIGMTLIQRPKQLNFTIPSLPAKSQWYQQPNKAHNHKELLPGQEKITRHSQQIYSSEKKGETVEYSREEFSELVREFKSSLSGITPEKKVNQPLSQDKLTKIHLPSNNNNNSGEFHSGKKHQSHLQHENVQIIELPTFRTPKSQRQDSIHRQTELKGQPTEVKQSSQEVIQEEEQKEGGYIEAISRLQYEKEFLTSEMQSLTKQNQKLIERIKELERSGEDQNLCVLKQQIYKLKFQNQELVNRVVEAENELIRQLDHSTNEKSHNENKNYGAARNSGPLKTPTDSVSKSLTSKQHQIHNLMQQNIQLHKVVQSLQDKQQQLIKTLESTKNQPSNSAEQEQLSYILAPSFESLFTFLKKLPSDQHQYHQILLNMIEGYERKVSQLREETVMLKAKHKELQDLFSAFKSTLQKTHKFLTSQKSVNSHSHTFKPFHDQTATKMTAQIKTNLCRLEQLNLSYFSKIISPITTSMSPHSSHSALISSLQSKINYHLMLLRSYAQGIGQADLELIESQLSDYLKQLKTRIPTVLEREEYEESNQSSLNASLVQEDEENPYHE